MGAWSLEETRQAGCKYQAPGNTKKKKKMPALLISSWNVRIMCPGLDSDLQLLDDTRKTAVIDRELQ